MTIPRIFLFAGSLLAAPVAMNRASGDLIFMPSGSTVWMKFQATAAPNGDDVAGSILPGPAPPNGIPLTTVTEGGRIATGFAEVLPDRVRTFSRNSGGFAWIWASFEDTYTVGGTATGPFSVTANLGATGTARSVPFSGFNFLNEAQVQLEIGTFSPGVDAGNGNPFPEDFRVTPFDATTTNFQTIPNFFSSSSTTTVAVDVATSYTQMVSVGDAFKIAYGINTFSATGEIDLRDTARVGFDLPEGVFLTSALGGTFGDFIMPAFPGDYNQNGIVDAADYVVWRDSDGTQSSFDLWRSHFGQTAGSGSSSSAIVPDPGSAFRLILASVLLPTRRRRLLP